MPLPFRYFGRTNRDFGRPLWEIVMNLKNFGKGRLVTKSGITKENPQGLCFYKIVSVHPHILDYPDQHFKGNIFVEEVFCGRKRTDVIDIGPEAGRADYRLLSKTDEGEILKKVEEFLANPENHKPLIRPRSTPFPPVWRLILARENKIPYEKVPEMPIVYDETDAELKGPTKLADEGETPAFEVTTGHGKPVHEEFYEHVIWNREAAREKYCNRPPPPPEFAYVKRELPPLDLVKKQSSSSVAI